MRGNSNICVGFFLTLHDLNDKICMELFSRYIMFKREGSRSFHGPAAVKMEDV